MAVKELSLVTVTHTETTWEHMTRVLSQGGFKLLGEGTFSRVFTNPNEANQVVKLMRLRGNTNALTWLEWCALHPSKYVPKVHDITLYRVKGGDSYAIVVLERLNMGADRKEITDWVQAKHVDKHVIFTKSAQPEILILPSIKDYDKDPELKLVMEQIVKIAGGVKTNQDISSENLARRTSGELVFVDPLTGD